ncbi:MAG TPA: hypothetical protein VLX91_06770 [Candidatus Acidoferrales bacterium]|nr:hypothetical protein [Candidatus Acidoferrales bacterium]
MARAITRTKRVDKQRKAKTPAEMPLKPINYKIIVGGALLIILSYVILANNNTVYGFIPLNLVPILLCIGYLIIVPFGILYRRKKTQTTPSGAQQNQDQIPAK